MSRRPRSSEAGLTLIEIVVAITLLSLLTVGMLLALRIGLNTFGKTGAKLMDNRRVAGAQRVLLQELAGLAPVVAPCTGNPAQAAARFPFFQGEQANMRLISTFSLHEAWRGRAQILEFTVIPGDEGGVRLVVNEAPYAGPIFAGKLCTGFLPDPDTGTQMARFLPIEVGPASFVLADKLEYCRFAYLTPRPSPQEPVWKPAWTRAEWPLAVRIDMAPLEPDPGRVQPISVVAPVQVRRRPEVTYEDK